MVFLIATSPDLYTHICMYILLSGHLFVLCSYRILFAVDFFARVSMRRPGGWKMINYSSGQTDKFRKHITGVRHPEYQINLMRFLQQSAERISYQTLKLLIYFMPCLSHYFILVKNKINN